MTTSERRVEPTWRWSPNDGQVHGFIRELGGLSEALCLHTVRTANLGDDHGPKCMGCMLNLGDQLADAHEAQGAWVHS